MKQNKIILSVVIICRNEESNIDKCIESVIKEVKDTLSEIIVIDSASTDRTISIAKKYPVKIFQLNQSKYLSPSAGRYIGTQYSKGEFIFFIDADTIIIKGWIKKALLVFSEKKLAGVRGRLCNVFPGENLNMKHIEKKWTGYDKILPGQASMYRRIALEECGTFHPYIKGEEERELYHRLKNHGWKTRIINVPMAYHINKFKNESEVDEKASYFRGVGQIFIKYKISKISLELLKDHKKVFFEIFLMYVWFFLVILLLILKLNIWAYISTIILALLLSVISIIKGPYKTYLYVRARIMTSLNVIKGAFMSLHDPSKYIKKVRIRTIKK